MGPDVLIPLAPFAMVVSIVGLVTVGRTVRYYLDWRMRMADRQLGSGDPGVQRTLQELRAEIAALKQHEAEAVLSFDSTLQTLDARVKHLERSALGDGAAERMALGAAAPRIEQLTPTTLKSG
jgi:hypothetical protein